MARKTAVEEFNTSSNFKLPPGHDAWQIKNDYPRSSFDKPSLDDKPWLKTSFETEPTRYCNLVKEYIFEGNTENNFILQKNDVRDWYHAPWLHYGTWGREPINGLKFGGYLVPGYLAKEQTKPVQGWLNSYFNREAATILGDMWGDKTRIPKWDKHLKFPPGSVICETIFVNNMDNVPFVQQCPKVVASIGKLPDGWKPDDPRPPVRSDDLLIVETLRLLQIDFAVNDSRSPIGWVFGTFACDGTIKANDPWDNVFPIGLQWGNDPGLLQKQYDQGMRPMQRRLIPEALDWIKKLRGDRPWLGWHERLDGLADDFMGTCTSCHATAQLSPLGRNPTSMIQDPKPKEVEKGHYVQENEEAERRWFRNIESGQPFDDDSLSADYNKHVEIGFTNYREWAKPH